MPQVDLETLLVCGERKIVCETLIDGPDNPNSPCGPPPDHLPADSFCLPTLEDEIDWFDRNAFYERKQSTKGPIISSSSSSSSLPNSGNLSSSSNPHHSHRISKSKPSIIGLPKRPDSRHLCQNTRRPATIRFFPKLSSIKSSVPEADPGSPKVSCIGRVRKPNSVRKRPSDGEQSPATARPFWKRFLAVFGCRRVEVVVLNDRPPSPMPAPSRWPEMDGEENPPAAAAPPSLGAMKTLASGRRPASWGAQADVHVAGDDCPDERRLRS